MATGTVGGFTDPSMSNFTQTPAPTMNVTNNQVQQQATLGGQYVQGNPQYTLPQANYPLQTQFGTPMGNLTPEQIQWYNQMSARLRADLNAIVSSLPQRYQITNSEFQALIAAVNNPVESQKLIDKTLLPFINMPSTSADIIWNRAAEWMYDAALKIRNNQRMNNAYYGGMPYQNPNVCLSGSQFLNNGCNQFNNPNPSFGGMTNQGYYNSNQNAYFGMMPNTFNLNCINAGGSMPTFPAMQGMQQQVPMQMQQNDPNDWTKQVYGDLRRTPQPSKVDEIIRPKPNYTNYTSTQSTPSYTPGAGYIHNNAQPQQTQQSDMSEQLAAALRHNKQINGNTAVPSTQRPATTGQPLNIEVDLSDQKPEFPTPRWNPMGNAAPDEMKEFLEREVSYFIGYDVKVGDNHIYQRSFRMKKPTQSVDAVFADLLTLHPAITDPTKEPNFCHSVVYDSLTIEKNIDTDNARTVLNKCHSILVEGRKEQQGMTPYLKVIKELESHAESFPHVINTIITRFNQAASVNFVKENDDGTIFVMNPVKSLQDIAKILVDDGSDSQAYWREDVIAFARALTSCIRYSFGAVFYEDESRRPIFDVTVDENLALVAADQGCGLRLKNGLCSRLVFATEDEKLRKTRIDELKSIAKRQAFVRINHKAIFTNIGNIFRDMDVETNRFGLHLPKESAEMFTDELEKKFGTCAITLVSDLDQFAHPVLIGRTFGGQVVGRRI